VINHSANGIFAIREGRWKLVAGTGSGGRQAPRGKPFAKPYQLYDLQLDLAEANDVAGDHPEIVERLTERLQRAIDAGRSVDR
jgi:arylsulfatase A-like enzyme